MPGADGMASYAQGGDFEGVHTYGITQQIPRADPGVPVRTMRAHAR